MIIKAIEVALLRGSETLNKEHFSRAFQQKSGCIDEFNPFLREDFREIDCRLLLSDETELGGRRTLEWGDG